MPTQDELAGLDHINNLRNNRQDAVPDTAITVDRLAEFARLYDTVSRRYNDTTNS